MKKFTTVAAIALLSLSALAFGGQVDINTADAETISAELSGIGLTKAKAIVEYRQKHGPFSVLKICLWSKALASERWRRISPISKFRSRKNKQPSNLVDRVDRCRRDPVGTVQRDTGHVVCRLF